MSKQAYFVVYVEEDGTIVIDDERAVAVFDGQDVWDVEHGTWVDCYEEAKVYEQAQERLQDAIKSTWK
jgi:membrane protease subunit (stomatin/prohibitin family)